MALNNGKEEAKKRMAAIKLSRDREMKARVLEPFLCSLAAHEETQYTSQALFDMYVECEECQEQEQFDSLAFGIHVSTYHVDKGKKGSQEDVRKVFTVHKDRNKTNVYTVDPFRLGALVRKLGKAQEVVKTAVDIQAKKNDNSGGGFVNDSQDVAGVAKALARVYEDENADMDECLCQASYVLPGYLKSQGEFFERLTEVMSTDYGLDVSFDVDKCTVTTMNKVV